MACHLHYDESGVILLARMKDLLLDAAVAVSKALDAGASVEQILETVDYIQDRPVPVKQSAWLPTHMANVETR